MHTLATTLPNFSEVVFFILFGAFLVVLVSFADAQAQGGWSSFAQRYPAPVRPDGKAYRVPSWTYCNVHWNASGLRVIFTDAGIYFYMTFRRRLAHPPFLLPWESVKRVGKAHGVFGEYSFLEIEDAAGNLRLDLSEELERELARHQKVA